MPVYPDHLDLGPLDRAAGIVRLPGSKSISNRILLLAALAARKFMTSWRRTMLNACLTH
jgi:5-enolpyruvylshikimate-3-phosphate synthase